MIDDDVVVDMIAGRYPRTISARTSILLNKHNAVAASCHVNPIAIHIDVPGVLDLNLSPPQPAPLVPVPIANEGVVADYRVVADLMGYADVSVMYDEIVLIERVDVVDVGPHAGAVIVVRVVAAHDKVISVCVLESAALPKHVDAGPVAVLCNLVALNEDVVAGAA